MFDGTLNCNHSCPCPSTSTGMGDMDNTVIGSNSCEPMAVLTKEKQTKNLQRWSAKRQFNRQGHSCGTELSGLGSSACENGLGYKG